MVLVADPAIRSNAAALRRLRRLVPLSTLHAVQDAHPDMDWYGFMRSLDGIYLAHGGGLGQARYLSTPQPELQGRTPVEALRDADGPERVARHTRQWVTRRNSAARQRRRRMRSVA